MEEKLDQMFGGVVATGQHAWAPCMNSQTEVEEDVGVNMETDTLPDYDDYDNCSQARGTSAGPSKRRRVGKNSSYDDKLERIAIACETIITQSGTNKSVNSPSSMATATIALENIPEICGETALYLYLLRFLKDKENHDTFRSTYEGDLPTSLL